MPSCGDLIDEVSAQLHGWGLTSDRVTPLAADIGPTDTTFTVDYATGQAVGITPGVVEIDQEQLYVYSVDNTTGIVTLAPGIGRGYKGTTPASHTAGSAVVSRPKFPRVGLFRQINEVLGSIYPDLFAVKTFTGTITWPSNSYTLPGNPRWIIDAQWQHPIGNWLPLRAYMLDPYDGQFRLADTPLVGRPLRVIYATEPGLFTSEDDDFATTTGLPDTSKDVLTLGAVCYQLEGLDISRAQNTSVEQSDRNKVVPPFAGNNAAKYLMAEYQQRLANEARSLRSFYKPRISRVW